MKPGLFYWVRTKRNHAWRLTETAIGRNGKLVFLYPGIDWEFDEPTTKGLEYIGPIEPPPIEAKA